MSKIKFKVMIIHLSFENKIKNTIAAHHYFLILTSQTDYGIEFKFLKYYYLRNLQKSI
jgi:hypothetical protein